MALPKLEGLITIPSGDVFTVQEFGSTPAGPENITVATDDYFWSTIHDGADSLLDKIGDSITDNVTLNGTYSCTLNSTTGKITISVSGGGVTSFTLTWGSSVLQSLMGFSGTQSGSTSYTGANQARYLWLPDVVRANPTAPDGDKGHEIGDFAITFAPSGHSKRTSYTRRYRDNLEFRQVVASKMFITHESTTNESLQKFWEDVIFAGAAINYHKDKDSGTHVEWVAVDGGSFNPTPVVEGWEGAASLWNYQTEVIESV